MRDITRTLRISISALCLLAALAPSHATAGLPCPGYENVLFCGELTNDCAITANDALAALRMAVGQLAKRQEADLDHNGNVAAGDALACLRIAVGSIPASLNCGPQYDLTATAVGFYNQKGGHTAGNYAVGWYASNGDELRDYFVFDLTPVPGTITAAMLRLSTAPSVQATYHSPDPSETYTVFNVATSPAVLVTGSAGLSAFDDLNEGTVYGTLVTTASLEHVVDFSLNAAGIAYLNGIPSTVALGGAITTLTKGASNEYLFNATSATNVRQLILVAE